MPTPDLTHALEQSIRIALSVGEQMREELYSKKGPIGADAKAPIDLHAERQIREKLLPCIPGAGFRAEEDPSADQKSENGLCWIIDPQDGTHAFLAGQRGATVSIALIENELPVLGVVYAYAAPTEAGDLFAWAKGCGPATRNGKELPQLSNPNDVSVTDHVLVSPSANVFTVGNAELVEPARFITCPSLAYRLARTAGGDAACCTSFGGPRDLDLAAGHALLIAVGGELYDEKGEALRYVPNQTLKFKSCVGGQKHIAKTIAMRDPKNIQAVADDAALFDFAKAQHHKKLCDGAVLLRAQGCLLGQFAGDSLGSLVEFRTPASILSEYPDGVRKLADGGTFNTIAGQPTDDSEMALALARSILKEGGYVAESVASAYVDWYESRPFDIGNTCSTAVRAAQDARRDGTSMVKAVAARASQQSQANGSLMRLAPLAVYGTYLPTDVLSGHAREDALLSHPHRVCQDANIVFALTIANAIATGATSNQSYVFALDLATHMEAESVVQEALQEAADGPPSDFMHQMGWLRIALQNAFYQLLHAPSLEEGIVDSVGRGGDTDTNAAIAGALLGAVHGRDAIPRAWQQAVESCRPYRGGLGIKKPRPKFLWPVDAMELAEQLVLAGV